MMTQSEVPVNPSQSDLRILWLPALICVILLSFELYFLFHDWSGMGRSAGANSGEPIAQFMSGKNSVRQKTVGTLTWDVPIPNSPLFKQSAIATMDDSEAVIVFNDQSELVVEPNSLLILEEAPTGITSGRSGKIVARLVKGSFKRRNVKKGTETPLFIKLSREADAPPVQIKDTQGDSVFRVVYKTKGFEVIVESGAVAVNGKEPIKAGEKVSEGTPPKLSAPRLKKPKIEILKDEEPESSLWNFKSLFMSDAMASESSKLSVHFYWEETPGANLYLIQISKTAEFENILIEKRTPHTNYLYKTSAPLEQSELYFRVAGITEYGTVGEFSAIEKVDVKPDPVKKEIVAEKKPEPTPAPTPKISKKAIPVPMKETSLAANTPSPYSGNFWLGATYDHRKFKSDGTLKEVSGSGVVPTVIGFEVRRTSDEKKYLSLGGVFLYEKAKAALVSPSDIAFSVTSLNAWATYGYDAFLWKRPLTLHYGPYLGMTSKVSSDGLQFASKNIYGLGAMVALQSEKDWFYRAQLAVLGVGAVGVDFSAWIRQFWPARVWDQQIFYGLKFDTRQTSLESSFSGTVELGVKI